MPTAQAELLRGLSPEEATAVMTLGTPVTAPAGQVLFGLGEPATRVLLVVRGRVALTLPMHVRGAEEDVLVEERMPGETLGWSGIIPPHRFTLKATALMDSELLAFEREALLILFESNPSIGHTVMRNIAGVIGHRLGIFQTMWLREMQRVVEFTIREREGA